MNFDYDEMDYMMNNAMDGGGGGGGGNNNGDYGDYFYDRYHMSNPRRRKRPPLRKRLNAPTGPKANSWQA